MCVVLFATSCHSYSSHLHISLTPSDPLSVSSLCQWNWVRNCLYIDAIEHGTKDVRVAWTRSGLGWRLKTKDQADRWKDHDQADENHLNHIGTSQWRGGYGTYIWSWPGKHQIWVVPFSVPLLALPDIGSRIPGCSWLNSLVAGFGFKTSVTFKAGTPSDRVPFLFQRCP